MCPNVSWGKTGIPGYIFIIAKIMEKSRSLWYNVLKSFGWFVIAVNKLANSDTRYGVLRLKMTT